MLLRERMEETENKILSRFAARAADSRGRKSPEPPCDVRTCYMRDRDRIIHSKAFRRLKHKTQMFLSPEKDHYRTRLTHTLEVSQISRTISRGMMLNEDLTEAIALGHDLGHTPFGHAGERTLTEMSGRPFRHNEQGIRVVTYYEREGRGLNLSLEVLDGMLCHTGNVPAETYEGQVVALGDRIAYISHDVDDSLRAGVLTEDDIPAEISSILGRGHGARINTLVYAMVDYGNKHNIVGMEPVVAAAMEKLRDFLFDNIYTNPTIKGEEKKGVEIIRRLYEYYYKNRHFLPIEYLKRIDEDGIETTVCDYIGCMTDRFAVHKFSELFIPKGWNV